MSEISQEQVVEYLSGLSVMDLVKLTETLEEKWGVEAAPAAVAAAPAAAGGGEAAAEQTEFTVLLKDVGGQKIQVIKAVREITGLGLKDAKDLVSAAPKEIKEGVSKDEANEIAEKLKAAGATPEIK